MKIERMFFCLILLYSNLCYAELAEAKRVERAKLSFAEYLNSKRESIENDNFLISLKKSMPADEFDQTRLQPDTHLTAIHFCTTAGGVLTLGLEKGQSAVNRVAQTDIVALVGTAKKRNVSAKELGEDFAPGRQKICGYEASMSMEQARRLSVDTANILAIEVQDGRRRFLAINNHMKDK